jgi:ubiquinone/menaquinone biosynthesis C-methylase UbiE
MKIETMNSKIRWPNLYDLLKDVIPNDHSRQVRSTYYIDDILANNKVNHVMDLGCGDGRSIDYFRKKDPDIKWVGVDIESSPEVDSRTRSDGEFVSYDGINLPFANDSFDLIFSDQVFEHVRYPKELLKEICRVLKPEGYFTGSVSYLEAYHSCSLWNYTPYGFKVLLEEFEMKLKQLRPSIDALTLIVRRLLGRPRFFNRYWEKESPLNKLLDIAAFIKRKECNTVNFKKLLFCGQFVFLVQKERDLNNENISLFP